MDAGKPLSVQSAPQRLPDLTLPPTHQWPVRLQYGPLRLRPLRYRDHQQWRELRRRNQAWTGPWDATLPPEAEEVPMSFYEMRRGQAHEARAGRMVPWVVAWDAGWPDFRLSDARTELIGQVVIANVARGAAQMASLGYWIDQGRAGHGIIPVAAAIAIDYAFTSMRLHRIEVCIRPENGPSLRVAEKLGLRYEGRRERYLHIAGQWRDHEVFVITREEAPVGGVLTRVSLPPGLLDAQRPPGVRG